ncbi:tyrosine-type recombinase/integrase [Paraburkholderia sp. 35.1]|uniref:tyrosine-type recombinase/integrase n=1 Tax=unclassified Paraburkholderia TaxID=2615204 RepID=UPI003D1DAD8D
MTNSPSKHIGGNFDDFLVEEAMLEEVAATALERISVYKCVLAYAAQAKIAIDGFGVHSLRATAATNALEHEADIATVQEWLDHANIATTRIYDRRKSRPEEVRRRLK